jgi:hypothetical protein
MMTADTHSYILSVCDCDCGEQLFSSTYNIRVVHLGCAQFSVGGQ